MPVAAQHYIPRTAAGPCTSCRHKKCRMRRENMIIHIAGGGQFARLAERDPDGVSQLIYALVITALLYMFAALVEWAFAEEG